MDSDSSDSDSTINDDTTPATEQAENGENDQEDSDVEITEENDAENEDNNYQDSEVEVTEEMDDENEENDDDDEDSEDQVKVPVINPLNYIKNKERRNALFKKMKLVKQKKQKSERKKRQREGGPRSTGHTIESLREPDQTAVNNLEDSDKEELTKELEVDDFSEYFAKSYIPKVLITFADNPCSRTRKFGLELSRIFPNALVKVRNNSSIKKIVKSANREEYTDVVIVNEDRRKPNGLLVIHLPNGPTAHFKLTNVKLTKDIRRHHKEITKHRPEVILTNFTTRLGLTVGRMLGALFHHDPEFKGRRAVTFHNQRDYIFFRHHRYEFGKNGKRVKLRELGPRFTLRLRSLQEGTFDSKCGDYAWIITNKRHAMEARRRFFL